jgi:type II secretory pathway pseudopilin PulG
MRPSRERRPHRQGASLDDARPSQARGGFTIVEVIAAIVVLTVGLLGLAGTTAYIIRQVTLANVMTERAVALQSVVEKVQAMDFATVGSGSDSTGSFRMSWTSADETSASKLVTVITVGPGLHTSPGRPFPMLGPSVADTFVYRVINR